MKKAITAIRYTIRDYRSVRKDWIYRSKDTDFKEPYRAYCKRMAKKSLETIKELQKAIEFLKDKS